MHVAKLENDVSKAVMIAANVLRQKGVIIFPTDTLYGLGTDALSNETVAKIYAIKGRNDGKPIHGIFSDLAMIERYAIVNDIGRKLAEKFFPGPLTLIFKKKEGIDTGIARGIESIGVRIPKNDFCIELALWFDTPITATSANISDQEPQRSIEKIIEQLGERAKLVDLAIDAGELPPSLPSTVVNVISGTPVVLREGAISMTEIANVVHG